MNYKPNPAPYDHIAEEYYDSSHQTSRNFDQTSILALEEARKLVPSSGLVLDVGAGRGRCNEFLGIDSKRVIQLDNSSKMLQVQPREDCLIKINHRADSLPFLDKEFSCVTAFLCDPFLGLNFLAEAYRVLDKGGLLVGTIPSFEWGEALRGTIDISTSQTRFKTKIGGEVTVPSILVPYNQLSDMMTVAGFIKEKIHLNQHKLPNNANPISPDIFEPARNKKVDVHELVILYSFTATK